LFGPSVLENLTYDLVDVLLGHARTFLTFARSHVDDQRESDSDELRELRDARSYWSLSSLLPAPAAPGFRVVPPPQFLKPDPTLAIITEVLLPSVRLVGAARPDLLLSVIRSMHQFVRQNRPQSTWDVPAVSDILIRWLADIFTAPDAPRDADVPLLNQTGSRHLGTDAADCAEWSHEVGNDCSSCSARCTQLCRRVGSSGWE
jgi:hypothetical protein